ncbi:MAG: hypothetical protein RBU21_11800 [FCB group bacterium]|nr:hypothetical protein [FCB group bacterium]
MMRIAMAAAFCVLAGGAWGQLPIPENPQWTPVRDEVYLQEVEGRLETKEPLLAVAVFEGAAYVGTANGVRKLEQGALVAAGGPQERAGRLKTLNGALWAFAETGLWRFSGGEWKQLAAEPFVDGCVHLGKVIVASPMRLCGVDGDALTPLNEAAPVMPIVGVASYAETIYVAHADRLGFLQGGRFEYDLVKDWGHLPLGSTVRDTMTLGSRLINATDKGLAELRGMSFIEVTGKDGLCYEDTTCIAKGFEKEDYWIGTTKGAIRAVDGEFQYFGYQRWIPNDKVNAIACGDRVVYIATDGGLGIITYEPYTLQKKAAYYERWLDEWGMRRMGFVNTLEWDDQLGEWVRFISDNDGGWAGHLLNAYSFKYAVTKDPAVREQALEIFRMLYWCGIITPIKGFPARSIATVGEPSHLAATGSAGLPSEWNPTPDGKWLWKGDTSSDEIDSHLQSTMIFYELAAQGKDKDAARDHVSRINAHIIDHGWTLHDLDGKPTRWARWDPEYFESAGGSYARGLNGLEILSHITMAHAITGDEKFAQGKQQLLDWGYQDHVLRQKLTFPVITHFDDRLGFLAYHPLLSYEKDPALRSIYRRSIERTWEVKRVENMVWFNYLYGALTGNDMDNERSLKNLQVWPLDCRSYTYKNSHRADLKNLGKYINYQYDWKCMTAREIGPTRWDDDFMRLDGGSNGMGVADPSAFLDAYWMARYYGMILPPDTTDPALLTVEKRGLQLGAKPYAGPQPPDVGF